MKTIICILIVFSIPLSVYAMECDFTEFRYRVSHNKPINKYRIEVGIKCYLKAYNYNYLDNTVMVMSGVVRVIDGFCYYVEAYNSRTGSKEPIILKSKTKAHQHVNARNLEIAEKLKEYQKCEKTEREWE